MVSPQLALQLTQIALANVQTDYPFHLLHLAAERGDVRPPSELHPLFGASYDWHSCVHMHWTLARCLRLFPQSETAGEIARHFGSRFTVGAAGGEAAYFEAPGRAAFERPYGWAWLLALCAELDRLARDRAEAAAWRNVLAPLERLLVSRMLEYLPRLEFAVRAGAHGNTAFALLLTLDYAQRTQHRALVERIEARSRDWFAGDRRYPAQYEPSGDDFLSPGLCEAALLARVLNDCDFAEWWDAFLPTADGLNRWLTPVRVSDAADPKIVHLHGLNLSRAWCWRALRPHLPAALAEPVESAVAAHLAASLPAATAGAYVATHWLASFALLALTDGDM